MDSINWQGLLAGLAAFAIIGVFHPIVIKMEYYLGRKSWWMLFFPGLLLLSLSFFIDGFISIILGCLAFALFWSTLEIFFQHSRVEKGRARMYPKRRSEYKGRSE